MNRRDFLKSTLQAAVALTVARSPLTDDSPWAQGGLETGPMGSGRSAVRSGPEFVAFGSPYRKSADRFASAGVFPRDRERPREETLHLRMPPEWLDRLYLGIRE